jgi:hypothetical protein
MSIRFSQSLLDNLRQRYEDTDEPLAAIAADAGIWPSSVNRIARRQGWRLRKDRPPRDLPPALKAQMAAEAAVQAEVAAMNIAVTPDAGAGATVADRLERAIEKELRAVEIMRATLGPEPQPAAEAERTARTLSTLTATLFKVRRLRAGDAVPEARAGQGVDDGDLPDDLDRFREALARRIETFVRSRAGSVAAESQTQAE